MRPLDPRLVRTVGAVRVHLAVTVACGTALTGLILAQAWLLARAISGATDGDDVSAAVAAVVVVAVGRALLSYGAEAAALRSAAVIKSQLRRRLVRHVTSADARPPAEAASDTADARPPAEAASATTDAPDAGEVVTLATRGLDALDDYVARYLPQLVLAVLVPTAVLVVVARADWISALVIGLTLPLIPVFMALVGRHTQARTRRQWRLLERLGGHFLDVVEGLPTLALFRRAKAGAAQIRRATDEHRDATMGTLRVAFLSGFVLELLATLAVALVAVEVGLRLLYGRLDLETALLVLILAPEAYLPLREVGARFHASTEGIAAAERVFAVLDRPVSPATAGPPVPVPPMPAPQRIRVEGVSLAYPGRDGPVLDGVSLDLEAGRTTLVTGRSGAGKSSLLALLLRFAEPTGGRITVDGRDLAELPVEQWRRSIAWVPQRPHLFDASVADNIRLGDASASDEAVVRAARLAEVHDVITALPDGYGTRLGERGTRLSAGERQRIALARAFLRREAGAPIVLLDEPTAHLDEGNADAIRRAVARLLDGATGVVVAHDNGWAELADDVVRLDAPVLWSGVPA